MPEYNYTTKAQLTGSRRGVMHAEGEARAIDFSTPPEFQGEGGWTPEHFFLAAVSSCYATTFQAISEYSKFSYDRLEVSAEGWVEKAEGGFRFKRVAIRPILTIGSDSDKERAQRMLEKSERACLVSRSINSEIVLEPEIRIASRA